MKSKPPVSTTEPLRRGRGASILIGKAAPLRRGADPAPVPPKGVHLQLSVPTDRPPAVRPHERTAGEMRIGPHLVIRRPHWGCSSVPYVYDLMAGNALVKRFCSPPSEQECADAIRLRLAAQHPPALVAPAKRGRGRPPTP